MIIAIEGPSAAGKTTWCRAHFSGQHVPETPVGIVAPDLFDDPAVVAAFWVNHAVQNWQCAVEIEQTHGFAVCDGDPFHLYFSWTLWRAGVLGRELFDSESALYRAALEHQEIGFVDQVLWIELPEAELRRRALTDMTRRRKRHEIYLTLVPWMKQWFAAREQLLPGSVNPLTDGVRVGELVTLPNSSRYELSLLDQMLTGFDL